MDLKVVAYRGFGRSGDSEVAYLILGKEVFFTGLHRGKTSTVNAAIEVVKAICAAEHIDWRDHTFYDLLCKSSYSGFEEGEYRITRLLLSQGERRTLKVSWEDVAVSPDQPVRDDFVQHEVPREVMKAFAQHIGTWCPPQIRDRLN